MNEKHVYITEPAGLDISIHAGREYPDECCGVLFGSFSDDGVIKVSKQLPAENISTLEERGKSYCIDPMKLFDIEKKQEHRGQEIVGFYHSHPDCAAVLSNEDVEKMIPELVYMIASVDKGIISDIRCWKKDLADGSIRVLSVKNIKETV